MTEELIRYPFILKNLMIKGVKQKIQDVAIKYEVPITHNFTKLIFKAWQGEPKGLIQVFWERGFIDPSNLRRYYAMKGTRDDHHNIRPDS